MEETIKVLKELINDRKSFICGDKEHDEIYINDIKSLENIINAYKEDERVIEEMAKFIREQDIDEDICTKKIAPTSEENDCYVDSYDENACCECVKNFFINIVREENKEE